MEKCFSTSYIISDNEGGFVLKHAEKKLQPGQPLDLSESAKVIIAGGFPKLSPDTSFPLSPTLQLNRDLADFNDESLISLAEAELYRADRSNYASYIVEADPRVCVVSSDPEALDTFIETYSGIIDIEPLLLGISHNQYSCGAEASISADENGPRLHYRKRAPLKSALCTYCGICGKICPEQCISAELAVDFNACTFCKECESACPVDALDMSGIEEITLRAPAVLLLGETQVEVEENCPNVFHDGDLGDFFKTLQTYEIKEVVCHNNTICQYSGRLDAGCSRCIDSCPYDAVSKGEQGITVDHLRCETCGICLTVCPTGAMQNEYFSDSTLVAYLQKLDISQGSTLVIGDEESMTSLWWRGQRVKDESVLYLEYPSSAFLSFYHFLIFFSSGFKQVIVIGQSETVEDKRLKAEADKANSIATSLFDCQFVSLSAVTSIEASIPTGNQYPLAHPMTLPEYATKRSVLSTVLKHLISVAGRELHEESIMREFPSIHCNAQGCTHCLACLNECRTEALLADDEQYSLTHLAGLCVGCGVCVTVCPEKVLSVSMNRPLNENFFTRQVIAQAEPVTCRECGKIYGTQKSLARVMQILSSRETIDVSHYELCSDCRVVKLFEAHE